MKHKVKNISVALLTMAVLMALVGCTAYELRLMPIAGDSDAPRAGAVVGGVMHLDELTAAAAEVGVLNAAAAAFTEMGADVAGIGDLTLTGDALFTGGFTFGVGELAPIGYADPGYSMIAASGGVTTTRTVTHGLTTPLICLCTLNSDVSTVENECALCSCSINNGTVTVKAWQDSFAAATVVCDISWLVFGLQ